METKSNSKPTKPTKPRKSRTSESDALPPNDRGLVDTGERETKPVAKDVNLAPRIAGDATLAPDPFDVESLRLKDATSFGVQKVLTAVPVRKPSKQEFVRVHPNLDYRITTAVYVDESDRDAVYMVAPGLRDELAGEITPVNLLTAITRHGDLFLWQLKISLDGRCNSWTESAAAAAELAESKWVRMKSNMTGRCYDVATATGPIPEPDWPSLSLKEILTLAFKGRFIDSFDHPILKALKGEV